MRDDSFDSDGNPNVQKRAKVEVVEVAKQETNMQTLKKDNETRTKLLKVSWGNYVSNRQCCRLIIFKFLFLIKQTILTNTLKFKLVSVVSLKIKC